MSAFRVDVNVGISSRCECRHFEFVGILCRHFLKVFLNKDVDTIPENFIRARWRQRANEFRNIYSENLIENGKTEESEALRLSQMIQHSGRIACLAASSYERSRVFIETMNVLLTKILDIPLDAVPAEINQENVQTNDEECPVPSQPLLLDPNVSQTKGRKKDAERFKSRLELALNKTKRMCGNCKVSGHNARTCPQSKNYKGKTRCQVDEEESSSN